MRNLDFLSEEMSLENFSFVFTYEEAKTLLIQLGFVEKNKGKTSGSRVQFINNLYKIRIELHKPHPGNILKPYQIENIINKLGGIYNE